MSNPDPSLGRTHLRSDYMSESLVSKSVMGKSKRGKTLATLPDANVVMLGGRSIFDRGKKAVFPLVDEIVACRQKHQLLLGVSGGVRVRHTYEIGLDLGLPTGGLAMITGAVEEQNATMLYHVMAKNGGICMPRDCFNELPIYLRTGMTPILICMPPHHYWEKPPEHGILPEYGSDYGIYMIAEVLDTRSLIFVKDQDGMYTDNPEKNPKAKLIPKIHIDELIGMNLQDTIVERSVLKSMSKSPVVKRMQIINGLKRGQLEAALEGENVGTVIYKD